MRKILTLAVITMLLASGLVFADAARAGKAVNRQIRQQKRIHQGVKSGELTDGEKRVLKQEQRHIQKAKRRAWSDGELSTAERVRLDRMQDRANKHIYKLKHNEADR